jgi:hypothetical protein
MSKNEVHFPHDSSRVNIAELRSKKREKETEGRKACCVLALADRW